MPELWVFMPGLWVSRKCVAIGGGNMSKNLNAGWARLAGAALDCRNELRLLLPRLDAAIAAGQLDTTFLRELRDMAARHAESIAGGAQTADRRPAPAQG